MADMLTEKELTLIADLLKAEEIATKKAALYSRTISNEKTTINLIEIRDSHKQKFQTLLKMI